MSSKGWINDELAKVMIASREGWAISRREFKPGRRESLQGMKIKSCIIAWKTSYDNIEFSVHKVQLLSSEVLSDSVAYNILNTFSLSKN